jgi:hypothetical protein
MKHKWGHVGHSSPIGHEPASLDLEPKEVPEMVDQVSTEPGNLSALHAISINCSDGTAAKALQNHLNFLSPSSKAKAGGPVTKFSDIEIDPFENGDALACVDTLDVNGVEGLLPSGAIPTWYSSNPAVQVSPSKSGLSALLAPARHETVEGITVSVSYSVPNGPAITVSAPVKVVDGKVVGG